MMMYGGGGGMVVILAFRPRPRRSEIFGVFLWLLFKCYDVIVFVVFFFLACVFFWKRKVKGVKKKRDFCESKAGGVPEGIFFLLFSSHFFL